jgi:hypothetical protein
MLRAKCYGLRRLPMQPPNCPKGANLRPRRWARRLDRFERVRSSNAAGMIIIEYDSTREVVMPSYPAKGAWTPEEDELLRKLVLEDALPFEIAAELRRSIPSVKARAFRLGIPLGFLLRSSRSL